MTGGAGVVAAPDQPDATPRRTPAASPARQPDNQPAFDARRGRQPARPTHGAALRLTAPARVRHSVVGLPPIVTSASGKGRRDSAGSARRRRRSRFAPVVLPVTHGHDWSQTARLRPEILRLGTKPRPSPQDQPPAGDERPGVDPDLHVWSQTAGKRPRNLQLLTIRRADVTDGADVVC